MKKTKRKEDIMWNVGVGLGQFCPKMSDLFSLVFSLQFGVIEFWWA